MGNFMGKLPHTLQGAPNFDSCLKSPPLAPESAGFAPQSKLDPFLTMEEAHRSLFLSI